MTMPLERSNVPLDNSTEEFLFSIAASLKRLADLAERIEAKAERDDAQAAPEQAG